MAHEKVRIARTSQDVLIANVRCQVGESITTWVMLRHAMAQAAKIRSTDPIKDIGNRELAYLDILVQKLQDELIANLAELGDEKVGRANFYFASVKIGSLTNETSKFSKFVISKQFRRKRNQEIAHREQPEQWFEDRPIYIGYRTVMRGLAMAVRLMKAFDRKHLGPASPYLWGEARKKRSHFLAPARAAYLLLPYLLLSSETRVRVALQEQAEGKVIWTEMKTTINGAPASILANKEWGLLLLGHRILPLDEYPLQSLESVNLGPEVTPQNDA